MKPLQALYLIAALLITGLTLACRNRSRPEAERLLARADSAFVQATGASEPALSGAVAAVEKGAVCSHPVKGNGGLYLFQVLNRADREGATFDEAQMKQQLSQQAVQSTFRTLLSDLRQKAGIVDKRYLYF